MTENEDQNALLERISELEKKITRLTSQVVQNGVSSNVYSSVREAYFAVRKFEQVKIHSVLKYKLMEESAFIDSIAARCGACTYGGAYKDGFYGLTYWQYISVKKSFGSKIFEFLVCLQAFDMDKASYNTHVLFDRIMFLAPGKEKHCGADCPKTGFSEPQLLKLKRNFGDFVKRSGDDYKFGPSAFVTKFQLPLNDEEREELCELFIRFVNGWIEERVKKPSDIDDYSTGC